MPINEVVTRWPAALAVLARHGLDMCCGGVHPLEFAAKAHGLDLEALLKELDAAVLGPAGGDPGAVADR
ncbi:MAG: DUF542 domain-containing protein [Elusimicrobia bacterium]|nr:DUF542 domain-containing protein [Elusimicrobiota bacterium]